MQLCDSIHMAPIHSIAFTGPVLLHAPQISLSPPTTDGPLKLHSLRVHKRLAASESLSRGVPHDDATKANDAATFRGRHSSYAKYSHVAAVAVIDIVVGCGYGLNSSKECLKYLGLPGQTTT